MTTEADKSLQTVEQGAGSLVSDATAHARSTIETFLARLTTNLSRARALLELHKKLEPAAPDNARGACDDLLRAVVVFLHATLEDVLRAIAETRLPQSSPEALNNVPLVGAQPGKFALGQLLAHKQKTVDALIEESICHYLRKESFNSTNEIAAMLQRLSIDAPDAKKHFPSLDEMIRRRHQIVHQADLIPGGSGEPPVLASISCAAVTRWIETVQYFTAEVLVAIGVEAAMTKYGLQLPDEC